MLKSNLLKTKENIQPLFAPEKGQENVKKKKFIFQIKLEKS